MRIHVTGATGFLGRELTTLIGQASARADLLDEAEVLRTIEAARPDVVIHTAYRQDGPAAREVVVAGTRHVADAARRVGARLIHLSSDVVFDGRLGRPYREQDTPQPCTAYGANKADAEAQVWASGADALVVRTSLLVGGPGRTPSKHELVARDPAAAFYVDELRSPIAVDDLAHALLELAGLGLTGILHVGGADDVSRAELAELVAGRPVRRAPAPPGRPLDCRLDSTRARDLLQTRLRGVREVFAGADRATGAATPVAGG